MRKAIILIISIFVNSHLWAQTREAITVTDWGELYSGYELTASDIDIINSQCPNGELQKVQAAYNESQWPAGINNLDGRNELRPKMFDYHVYKVATLTDGAILIVAPSAENKHMPADMQSKKDIYFVLSPSGFGAKLAEIGTEYVAVDYSNLTTFDEQLNAILGETEVDFVNLMGEDIYDDPTFAEQYVSNLVPEGALYSTIDVTYDYYYSLWADYGTFSSQADAKNAFLALVAKISKARLTYCTLTRREDFKDETTAASSWADYEKAVMVEAGISKYLDDVSLQYEYSVYMLVGNTY